jgi:hypothetical protein
MAKVIEEKYVVVLSRLVKTDDQSAETNVLNSDQLETLTQAVEGLVDDPTVVVEVIAYAIF